MLSNLHIPKFVLETQVPFIRDVLRFSVGSPKLKGIFYEQKGDFYEGDFTMNKRYITEKKYLLSQMWQCSFLLPVQFHFCHIWGNAK